MIHSIVNFDRIVWWVMQMGRNAEKDADGKTIRKKTRKKKG